MPLYEYFCNHCLKNFEIKLSFAEKDTDTNPFCPYCQSQDTQQKISAGFFLWGVGATGGYSPTLGCEPGAGSSCCGG